MNSKTEQNQAAVDLFAGESTFTLTDAVLLAIHGGTSPSGGGAPPSGGDAGGYGMTEFRQDVATVGSSAGLGNLIAPGGTGALAGAFVGAAIVAEDRLDVSGHVYDAASFAADLGADFANNVIENEEVHRSNII